MNQHHHQGYPHHALLLSTAKKRTKKLIDKNILQQKLIDKQFKNNQMSHYKKQKYFKFQEIVEHSKKEPIISVALNCGIKNGRNQVLNQYSNVSVQGKIKEIEMNSFQKIISRHRKSRNFSEQSKRLTFVNFKKSQKDIFFTSLDFRPLKSKQQRTRAKTEPSPTKSSFQRTCFPKQLTDLKQQIRDLVSSKQNRKRPIITLPTTTYPEQFNISTFTNNLNQTMINSHINHFGENTYQRRQLFKGSKCGSIKDYIEQINQVITYADEVMQQEDKMDFKDKFELNEANSKQPKKLTYYRKYWPEYKRYTLNLRKQEQDHDSAKFFNSFSQSDLRLGDDLQNLVNTIKVDLNHQEQQINKEIAQQQRNAINQRFKYKMDIERENYKRNIKSFIKCKKEYKIERRREEVRANGIIRLKKATRPEKMIPKVQENDNQN